MFINRILETSISKQVGKYPVIAVTGPRQSGKTTLLKKLFSSYRYVSLENPDTRYFATADPNGFLDEYAELVIFDEVQRVPELFSYIQQRVDESGKMGQFVLSGSQNFHLIETITQTLAGRVALFKLFPFDMAELKQHQLLEKNFEEACIKGFYPAIFHRKIDPVVFYANYIETYIDRDISTLINIRDMKAFRNFVRLCAGRAGQLLNMNALANDCHISQPTAKSWLSLLESSYIIFLLEPHHENFNKRIIKTPKLYFYDSGLLCHLLRIKSGKALAINRLKGNIFENMIASEFQKRNAHQYLHEQYYFWQDSNANEIDLLKNTADGFSVFEIKATKTIKPELFKNIEKFAALASPSKVEKTLIYAGDKNQARTNYKIVSWQNM